MNASGLRTQWAFTDTGCVPTISTTAVALCGEAMEGYSRV
jgi:hypothetical protein